MSNKQIKFQGVTISGPAADIKLFTTQQLGYDPSTQYKTRTSGRVIDIAEMSTSYVFNSMLMMIIDYLRTLQAYDDKDLTRHQAQYKHVGAAAYDLVDVIDFVGINKHVDSPSFIALRNELKNRGVL